MPFWNRKKQNPAPAPAANPAPVQNTWNQTPAAGEATVASAPKPGAAPSGNNAWWNNNTPAAGEATVASAQQPGAAPSGNNGWWNPAPAAGEETVATAQQPTSDPWANSSWNPAPVAGEATVATGSQPAPDSWNSNNLWNPAPAAGEATVASAQQPNADLWANNGWNPVPAGGEETVATGNQPAENSWANNGWTAPAGGEETVATGDQAGELPMGNNGWGMEPEGGEETVAPGEEPAGDVNNGWTSPADSEETVTPGQGPSADMWNMSPMSYGGMEARIPTPAADSEETVTPDQQPAADSEETVTPAQQPVTDSEETVTPGQESAAYDWNPAQEQPEETTMPTQESSTTSYFDYDEGDGGETVVSNVVERVLQQLKREQNAFDDEDPLEKTGFQPNPVTPAANGWDFSKADEEVTTKPDAVSPLDVEDDMDKTTNGWSMPQQDIEATTKPVTEEAALDLDGTVNAIPYPPMPVEKKPEPEEEKTVPAEDPEKTVAAAMPDLSMYATLEQLNGVEQRLEGISAQLGAMSGLEEKLNGCVTPDQLTAFATLDQLEAVNARVDGLEAAVESMKAMMDERLAQMERQLQSMAQAHADLEEKLGGMVTAEAAAQTAAAVAEGMKAELQNSMEKSLADVAEEAARQLTEHEVRIAALEQKAAQEPVAQKTITPEETTVKAEKEALPDYPVYPQHWGDPESLLELWQNGSVGLGFSRFLEANSTNPELAARSLYLSLPEEVRGQLLKPLSWEQAVAYNETNTSPEESPADTFIAVDFGDMRYMDTPAEVTLDWDENSETAGMLSLLRMAEGEEIPDIRPEGSEGWKQQVVENFARDGLRPGRFVAIYAHC